MDIDMSILRMLEREKEISFEVLVEAIEQALLTAYQRTPGAAERARVHLDRTSGHVTVHAVELDAEGNPLGEYDDTPEGFGRIAATTARQMMLQRLRDAEDDVRFGEFSGREGDVISGVVQQGRNPDDVLVDLGKLEAVLPAGERVPGESYPHGSRVKALVVSVRKGTRGPQVTLSRSHPNLVRKLFALEVPEIADGTVEIAGIAREAGHRTKIAVRSTVPGVNAKGSCIGPMGQRVRNVMAELRRGEDRHRRLLRRPGGARRPRPVSRAGLVGGDRVHRGPLGARRGARLPALAGHRQGGAERPARRTPHRLAHRHPLRRGAGADRAGGLAARVAPERRGVRAATRHGGGVTRPGVPPDFSGATRRARVGPVAREDRSRRPDPTVAVVTGPVRTCVGCRERAARSELLRVVAGSGPDGRPAAVPDPSGSAPGRGAHVHPATRCLDLAVRRKAFGRALRAGPALDPGPVAEHVRSAAPQETQAHQ